MKPTLFLLCLLLCACTPRSDKKEFWIYTSLYKNTVADVDGKLRARFPGVEFKFFQAGSEEVAAKVGAEELAGGTRADLLIFSDRFWFEEMARLGRFRKLPATAASQVPAAMKHPEGLYSAVSFPIMVLIYNSDAVPTTDAPKSFREMGEPRWKKKFTTGSPLASGTNFTTVAFLQKSYGWEYFRQLRANEVIAEGGNSSVIRRVQTKERPVGWVLLENALPARAKDPRLEIVYPTDGPVVQNNVLAILDKPEAKTAEDVAAWFFGAEGQAAMRESFMYPAIAGEAAPPGAKPLSEVLATAPAWTPALVEEFMKGRDGIKEQFMEIVLQ